MPLREFVRDLPDSPGIYKFLNTEDKLIYVGKAKSLKKRVSSYFNKDSGHNQKTRKLISEIKKIEFTLTPTEFDALLLENNFIKQYQPKYNILLKDDKTFPYICILNERFPRIISTRKFIAGNGEYFGPYASVVAMNNVLSLVRRLYSVRTCSLNLSEQNIEKKKFKICLEYHLGNCKGPCEGLIQEAEYNTEIQHVRKILKGNLSEITQFYSEEMNQAAQKMEYEKAAHYKRKLDLLSGFRSKNTVVNKSITDLDVITITSDEEFAYINFMQIKEGAIIHSQNKEIEKKLSEPDAEILALIFQEMKRACLWSNQEILSNIEFEHEPGLELTIPKIGDKKRLIDLSIENAKTQVNSRQAEIPKSEQPNKILIQMQADLKLPAPPLTIECFDNSNLQGTNPVASMVQFHNGRPRKSEYRKFNIKTVTGPDDFASMFEIVTRRYTRLTEEEKPYPNLIIVDGGKCQLSSACSALKQLGIYGEIPIIGIAKDLEEIYYPEDSIPLLISKRSPTLRLIQQIRDEAHRFGITFHRAKRSKDFIKNASAELPGIGQGTYEKLIKHFRSLKKIKAASLEELSALIGKKKASIILNQPGDGK